MNNYISPRPYNVLPPVVKNLLIINGLFFLAKIIFPTAFHLNLDNIFGLHYFGSQMFYPFQFITYMFMHADIGHIFFNMFALWMFGSTLENFWGAKRFIIFYFVTGIGAALVHYTVFYFQIQPVMEIINNYIANPDIHQFTDFIHSNNFVASEEIANYYNTNVLPALANAQTDSGVLQITVDFMTWYKEAFLNSYNVMGASGAVYGLLLAFGMTFPNALIYIYFLFPLKAKWFVIIFGAIELFSGLRNSPTDNVAHFAHLGGMLFGIILLLFWKNRDKNNNFIQY